MKLYKDPTETYQIIGLEDGWKGLLDADTVPLSIETVEPILHHGGTILGSSRTNIYKNKEDTKKAIENYKKLELDALVAVGGDDTLEIAYYLNRDHGLNTVGVPKTIDNDVLGTDFTFGFWSAVEKATAAIDDLRTTTMSHHRVMVVECMGRHAGWITAYAGLAGATHFIAVPEKEVHIDDIAASLNQRKERGQDFSIVAVAEGASIKGIDPRPPVVKEGDNWTLSDKEERDSFGNLVLQPGTVADAVARGLSKATGFECRGLALGHLQRGGSPSAYDRILGTRYGVEAAKAVMQGKWGYMAVLASDQIHLVTMDGNLRRTQDVEKRYKTLPLDFMDLAETFFG